MVCEIKTDSWGGHPTDIFLDTQISPIKCYDGIGSSATVVNWYNFCQEMST
jgi:hypothetical protein